jgi:hypothetical protein
MKDNFDWSQGIRGELSSRKMLFIGGPLNLVHSSVYDHVQLLTAGASIYQRTTRHGIEHFLYKGEVRIR